MDFNKLYKQNPKIYGDEPSDWIKRILDFKPPPADILDLGIGQGRNALFLAEKGYDVTGVDISEVGLKQCLEEAKKKGVTINCLCKDIYEFKFDKKYDVIYSTASLHYLGRRKKLWEVIRRMKKNTKSGGLNIISSPTDTKIAMDFPFYFRRDELKKLYSDWEVLEFDEIEDNFSNGKTGTIAHVIARKPKSN